MEADLAWLYPYCMPRKKAPLGSLLKRPLSPNFIGEWRDYRGLKQEALAERASEYLGTSFTAATLSRIENRKSPYSQRQLDAFAEVLSCSPADLIVRNPLDEDAPWTIWDTLTPQQRRQGLRLLNALKNPEEDAA